MKEMLLGNTKVTVIFSKDSDEVEKENLTTLYDVCNKLFKDKPECFYTTEEVKQLKQDQNNIFL